MSTQALYDAQQLIRDDDNRLGRLTVGVWLYFLDSLRSNWPQNSSATNGSEMSHFVHAGEFLALRIVSRAFDLLVVKSFKGVLNIAQHRTVNDWIEFIVEGKYSRAELGHGIRELRLLERAPSDALDLVSCCGFAFSHLQRLVITWDPANRDTLEELGHGIVVMRELDELVLYEDPYRLIANDARDWSGDTDAYMDKAQWARMLRAFFCRPRSITLSKHTFFGRVPFLQAENWQFNLRADFEKAVLEEWFPSEMRVRNVVLSCAVIVRKHPHYGSWEYRSHVSRWARDDGNAAWARVGPAEVIFWNQNKRAIGI